MLSCSVPDTPISPGSRTSPGVGHLCCSAAVKVATPPATPPASSCWGLRQSSTGGNWLVHVMHKWWGKTLKFPQITTSVLIPGLCQLRSLKMWRTHPESKPGGWSWGQPPTWQWGGRSTSSSILGQSRQSRGPPASVINISLCPVSTSSPRAYHGSTEKPGLDLVWKVKVLIVRETFWFVASPFWLVHDQVIGVRPAICKY